MIGTFKNMYKIFLLGIISNILFITVADLYLHLFNWIGPISLLSICWHFCDITEFFLGTKQLLKTTYLLE